MQFFAMQGAAPLNLNIKAARMSALQNQYERSVADEFFEWFNAQHGTNYIFLKRAGEAPDLIYSLGESELLIEVTAGYYDGEHARFLWEAARRFGCPQGLGWSKLWRVTRARNCSTH
ncbi:MAG TPA: hypothetical protein VGK97_06455 [Spongiibacteraceae bacterium]|jgi:hypothetical protein